MPKTPPTSDAAIEPPAQADSSGLIRALYGELRAIAARYFQSQPDGHTLQPTILVHEAFLKLQDWHSGQPKPLDRTHFLAIAAKAMRQVLIDHARAKATDKRGGCVEVYSLRPDEAVSPTTSVDVLQLHDALEQLASFDPRAAAVVELRFFAGMSIAEAARTLDVSDWTVEEDWRIARAWLAKKLTIH